MVDGAVDELDLAATDCGFWWYDETKFELEEKETQQLAHSAILGLPDQERAGHDAIYHLGGCSYREIASFLGLPPATGTNRLRSSRRRLGNVLTCPAIASQKHNLGAPHQTMRQAA